MKVILIIGCFITVSSSALGQEPLPTPTLEQTFRDIGEALRGNSPVVIKEFTPAGQSLITKGPITALTGPSTSAPVGATLAGGTPIQVVGTQNGYVHILPLDGPTKGKDLYVTEGVFKTGLMDTIVDQAANLVDSAARVAIKLQNNPFVRLKGFKLIAFPPSLEADFEMKETSPIAKQ